MAKNANASNLLTPEVIPGISQWVVPADPNDVTSRPKFIPWKVTVEKDGTFKFQHQGIGDPIIKKKVEVIFLSTIKETQCRCTRKGDTNNTVICQSHDRVLSRRGDDCKTECPYAEPNVPAENKSYSRPLRQTAVFLFRPEGSNEPFKLARFISSLNNVKVVNELKDKFRQLLVAQGVANPYPSAHVALVTAATESVAKGTVGRFSRDIEFAASLNKEAVKAVAELNAGVMKTLEEMFANMSAYNQRVREQRLAAGTIGGPVSPAATTGPKAAPAAPKPTGPQPDMSAPASEDIGGEIFSGDLGDEDDELPF